MSKIDSIIQALENIDAASLHGILDDLFFAGALLQENLDIKHKLIDPAGWNPSKRCTISSPTDSQLVFQEGVVFEYSRREDWARKLKEDVESVREWAEQNRKEINYFIFVTNRDIGNKKIGDLTPEGFIEQKLSKFNTKAFVVGQKSLLVVLQNSDFFYIRRRWLNTQDDYFQSLELFEKYHTKQAQTRHIYLEHFEKEHWYDKQIETIRGFISGSDKNVLLMHSQGGIGKTRFVIEACKQIRDEKEFKNLDFLFNKRRKYVSVGW